MKKTTEEKLMRALERLVDDAAKKMSPREFKRTLHRAHLHAVGVIAKHACLVELWTAMDARTQARAAKNTKKLVSR